MLKVCIAVELPCGHTLTAKTEDPIRPHDCDRFQRALQYHNGIIAEWSSALVRHHRCALVSAENPNGFPPEFKHLLGSRWGRAA